MADLIPMLAAVAGQAGKEADEDFNQTVLLLHGDGTNGAQNNTFLDGSTNNFTITRNGNTTQGTFSPFSVGAGEWSNYFDGGDRFRATASALSSSSFTVETWIYYTGSSSTNATIFDFANAVNGYGMYLNHTSAGNITLSLYSNNAGSFIGTVSTSFSGYYNQWVHVAATYDGSTYRLFLNGTSVGTPVSSATQVVAINSLTIAARSDTGVNQAWIGYLSNFRYVTGAALYTTTFTPPTSPLSTAGSGTTQTLFCQSNRFVDNTGNYTYTISSDPKVTPFSPFAPSAAYSASTNGGSGYWDGSGDYLTIPAGSAFAPGTGDFTIEGWVYVSSSGSLQTIWAQTASGHAYFVLYISSDAKTINFGINPSGFATTITSASTFALNQWNHFAVSRTSGTVSVYCNGSRGTATTNTTNLSNTTYVPNIGRETQGGTELSAGYISSLRYIKGTGLYSGATITVPTAPLTAISGTEFLCNFTNAGIFDNTGKNNLETVGNAQIDTGTKKYGTGSMEFDGTGDYLIPNGATTDSFAFGSGDFTIEFWVYLNNVSGTKVIYEGRPAGGSGATPTIYMSSASIRYFANGADRITGGNLSATTWYHIAVSRSGTSTKLFIDGTQSGSTYTDSTTYTNSTNRPLIGVGEDLGNGFNGYIDDLRITKGVARYTANFTAPTKAFPDL